MNSTYIVSFVFLAVLHKKVIGRKIVRNNVDEDVYLTKSNDVSQKGLLSPSEEYYRNEGVQYDDMGRVYDIGIAYGSTDFDSLPNSDGAYSPYGNDDNGQRDASFVEDSPDDSTGIPEELGSGHYEMSDTPSDLHNPDLGYPSPGLFNSPFMNPYQLEIPTNPKMFPKPPQRDVGLNDLPKTIDTENYTEREEELNGTDQRRVKRDISFRVRLSEIEHNGPTRKAEAKLVLNDHATCGRGRRRRPDSGSDGEGDTAGGAAGGSGGDAVGGDTNDVGAGGEAAGEGAEQLRLTNAKKSTRRRNTN